MKANVLSIDEMIGKYYRYRGTTYHFLSHKVDGAKITIVTNKKWFNHDRQSLADFLQECYLEDSPGELALIRPGESKLQLAKPDKEADEVMAMLKGELLENIKRVKGNAEYVPQAQMVAKSIQTLINLQKMELEILKLQNKD